MPALKILQRLLFAAAWFSVFWLVALVSWYDREMPRAPDPAHGRILPVVIVGSGPMYLTAHESQMWHFTQYASWSMIILFFAILVWRTNVKSTSTPS